VLRYRAGETFEPHYDLLDPAEPARAAQMRESRQRLITFLVSLSEDFEGGETDFPMADYRYKGRKGDAVFFHNVTESGALDYKALHAGRPVARGEKWALVRVCTKIPDA
jgi:prolyl 4-hydroxylase